MKNFATAMLDGHLTSDPQLRKTVNGKAVSFFSIAVNHGFKNADGKEEVSYFDIEAWGKMGENCKQYLSKGRKVTIQGELKQDRWITPDGTNRQKVKIVASSVRFDSMPHNGEKNKAA